MTPTSVIVIGGEVPASLSHLPSLLIRIPGEEGAPGPGIIAPKTLDECLLSLREIYADHQKIATLGGTLIVADHPIQGTGDALPDMCVDHSPHGIRQEWAPRIEAKLCELLDDLGNCMLDSWKGARHAILNGESIAKCPTSAELRGVHAGETAIVIGSGPSASDHLDEIARIRPGVRIFCADTILHGLLRRGIVPDYVCAIEREANITRVLAEGGECGATLIASPVVEPELVRKWGKNVLFWWGADDLYRWIAPGIEPMSSGRSSGALALAAASQAGCTRIFLVGHDLAYRNGTSHAADAHEIAHSANARADSVAHPSDPSRQRCTVEGNSTGPVETNGLWNRIRGDIEAIVGNNPDWQVVNVCNMGGARIAGAPDGSLPFRPFPVQPVPPLTASGIPSPLKRTTSIMVALLEMQDRIKDQAKALDAGDDLDQVAEALQVSRLAGTVHAPLLHYVTRSLYSSMAMRLHLNASRGMPRAENHCQVLGLTITALRAMVERMLRELPC